MKKAMKSGSFLQIVVLLFTAAPVSAFAATQAGVLGGLAVTGSTSDSAATPNLYSTSAAATYRIGIEGEYDFVPNVFGLELDFLYGPYNWEQATIGVPLAVELSSKWFELPLIANYVGVEWFKFGIGPVFDIATGSVSTQNADGTNPQSLTFDQQGWGKLSVGVVVQAGLSYPFLPGWLVNADARYLMGLTNIVSNPASTAGAPSNIKLHAYELLVGVARSF